VIIGETPKQFWEIGLTVKKVSLLITEDNMKLEGEVVPVLLVLTKHHAMQAYWGSGDIALRILDLGTTWR